ncbi:hypothetical protein HK101_002415 [Irineochytrium annulatum]|nr:hypothetical protein HK101_002415 [Irineochytrium annulatum]
MRLLIEDEVVVDLGPRARTTTTPPDPEGGPLGNVEFATVVMTKMEAKGVGKHDSSKRVVPAAWKFTEETLGRPVEFAYISTQQDLEVYDGVMRHGRLEAFLEEFCDLLDANGFRDLFGLCLILPTRPNAAQIASLRLDQIVRTSHAARESIVRYCLPKPPTNSSSSNPSQSATVNDPADQVRSTLSTLPLYTSVDNAALLLSSQRALTSATDATDVRDHVFLPGSHALNFRAHAVAPRLVRIGAYGASVILDLVGATPRTDGSWTEIELHMCASSLTVIAPREWMLEQRLMLLPGSYGDNRERMGIGMGRTDGGFRFKGFLAFAGVSVEEPFAPNHHFGILNPDFRAIENVSRPPMILKAGQDRRVRLTLGALDLLPRPRELVPRGLHARLSLAQLQVDLTRGVLQTGLTVLTLIGSLSIVRIVLPGYVAMVAECETLMSL